ncbi:MAG: hypothetical protein KDC38_06490 [Planctomycetes bacterium]|nr:hypothetical protein [Planctomycetota bacterium]
MSKPFLSLILSSAFVIAGVSASAQEQAPSSLPDLVRETLAGSSEALDRLSGLGVPSILEARPLFGSEESAFSRYVRRVVELELRRAAADAPGLRFHGQFAHLAAGGPAVAPALLAIFRDDDAEIAERRSAGYALGDLGDKAVAEELQRIADDFLTEPWLEREAVYLLARLGDRRRVQKWIEASQKVTGRELNTTNLSAIIGAHTELGEIYYRIREYGQAMTHHQRKLVLLQDLRLRVAPELIGAVDEEIGLVRYNLACSSCLAGALEVTYEQLDRAIGSGAVTLEMVRNDGDLAALRSDGRYAAWIAGHEATLPRPEPKPPEPSTPQPEKPEAEVPTGGR